MKEIKDIIDVIVRNKTIEKSVLSLFRKGSKLQMMYDLIRHLEVETDDEALVRIYKKNTPKSRAAYSKLKLDLKNKLLRGNLLAITKEKKYYEIQRRFLEIKLLIYGGSKAIGLSEAIKLLKKSKEEEFWDIALFLLRIIRRLYMLTDIKKFDKYDKELKQAQQTYGILLEAESLFYRLTAQSAINKTHSKALLKEAKDFEYYLDTVDYLPSVGIFFLKTAISTFYLMAINDYEKAVAKFKSAISELKTFRKQEKGMFVTLLSNSANCNIYLKRFEEAKINIVEAYNYVEEGSFNWMQIKTTEMTSSFYSGSFTTIFPIYEDVVSHKNFKKLPSTIREVWALNFAWIRLLHETSYLEIPIKYRKERFSVKTFLVKVKHFSKDKEGMNVNILVLRVLWLLIEKDYDSLIMLEDNIKRYRSRYAIQRTKTARRAYLILRYLEGISKRAYIDYKCIQTSKTIRKEFAKSPFEIKSTNFEIEILPFEVVVDIVEATLKKNKRRLR